MEPLSLAGYLVLLVCVMADRFLCLREQSELTNYLKELTHG